MGKIVIFIGGAPGIGKSQFINQLRIDDQTASMKKVWSKKNKKNHSSSHLNLPTNLIPTVINIHLKIRISFTQKKQF